MDKDINKAVSDEVLENITGGTNYQLLEPTNVYCARCSRYYDRYLVDGRRVLLCTSCNSQRDE